MPSYFTISLDACERSVPEEVDSFTFVRCTLSDTSCIISIVLFASRSDFNMQKICNDQFWLRILKATHIFFTVNKSLWAKYDFFSSSIQLQQIYVTDWMEILNYDSGGNFILSYIIMSKIWCRCLSLPFNARLPKCSTSSILNKIFYPSVRNRVKNYHSQNVNIGSLELARNHTIMIEIQRAWFISPWWMMIADWIHELYFLNRMIYMLNFITILFIFGPFFLLQRWMRLLIRCEFEAQLQARFSLMHWFI